MTRPLKPSYSDISLWVELRIATSAMAVAPLGKPVKRSVD